MLLLQVVLARESYVTQRCIRRVLCLALRSHAPGLLCPMLRRTFRAHHMLLAHHTYLARYML